MSLLDADAIYEVAKRVKRTLWPVDSPDLRRIDGTYGRIYRAHHDSEIWSEFMRAARWTLWDVTETPLPSNHSLLRVGTVADDLRQMAEELQHRVDPQHFAMALQIAGALQALGEAPSDPLGQLCRSVLMEGDLRRSRLVVRRPKYREAIEEHFGQQGCPVGVITETEVRGLPVMERLVMTGQIRWHRSHIYNAPRARELHTVRFDWLKGRDVDMSESARFFPPAVVIQRKRQGPATSISQGPADYLAPSIDWSGIRRQAEERAGIESPDQETDTQVEGRLFLLGGGFGVILSDERYIHVVDLDEEEGVNQMRVRDVRIGGAIVLRREGGERDFIADIADEILGESAETLRGIQSRWKGLLKRQVRELGGVPNTERVLRKKGTQYQNVGYWLTSENIRTARREDFRILMQLVGLEKEAMTIWDQMGRIDSAHRKAGARIREMLLQEVRSADFRTLDRDGYLDFELPTQAAGTLTAFRVEQRDQQRRQVARKVLRQVFNVDPKLWLS